MENGWSGRYRAVVCQAAARPIALGVANTTGDIMKLRCEMLILLFSDGSNFQSQDPLAFRRV